METPSQFDKFGLTLVRSIMRLHIRPTTPVAAVGMQALDVGIALLEQDAFAAVAVPDMNFRDDQPGRGWVYRDRFMIEDNTSATAGVVRGDVVQDLKGKRKINDMELVLLIDNNSAVGTAFSVTTEGIVRLVFLR